MLFLSTFAKTMEPSSNRPSGDIDAYFASGSIFKSGSSSSTIQTENSGEPLPSSNQQSSENLDAFFKSGSIFKIGSCKSPFNEEGLHKKKNQTVSGRTKNERMQTQDSFVNRSSNISINQDRVTPYSESELDNLFENPGKPSYEQSPKLSPICSFNSMLDREINNITVGLDTSASEPLTPNIPAILVSEESENGRERDYSFRSRPKESTFRKNAENNCYVKNGRGNISKNTISKSVGDVRADNEQGHVKTDGYDDARRVNSPILVGTCRSNSQHNVYDSGIRGRDGYKCSPGDFRPDSMLSREKHYVSEARINEIGNRLLEIEAENKYLLRHLSLSDDNICSKKVNYSKHLLGRDLQQGVTSSTGDISYASYKSNASSESSSNLSCGRRRNEISYRFNRSLTLRGCEKRRVTSIASVPNKRLFWVALKDKEGSVLKLCDFSGNEQKSLDVGAFIDDLAVSDNGDLFLSCPQARRIKVIRWCRRDEILIFADFRNTECEWFPRGLEIHPDGAVIACLTMSHWEKLTEYPTDSCVKRFEADSERPIGSFVTNEKCFGYPLRVSVNTRNEMAVFDYGFRCITLLNYYGEAIAKFNEVNDIYLSHRIALGCNRKDEFIVVQKIKPDVFAVKVDGSPFTARMVNMGVSGLFKSAVSAMAFDTQENMIVGSFYGVIKIFEETIHNQQP